jgi:ribokinase
MSDPVEPAVPPGLHLAVVGHVEVVEFVAVPHLPVSGAVLHAAGDGVARAAGGGAVAAAVLADLGARVDFFCALGEDELGRHAAAELSDRGITIHVAWRDAPTRRAITLIEPRGERTIITLGDRLEPAGADPLAWERLDDTAGVFITAGDAAAAKWARAAPVLVASPRARRALTGEIGVDALVYSDHDADETAWADRVGDRARLRFATAGAAGGRWWGESEGRWSAVAPPGPIADAYGCGDSFMAALTAGLAAGMTIAEAAHFGAVAGARALTRPGVP